MTDEELEEAEVELVEQAIARLHERMAVLFDKFSVEAADIGLDPDVILMVVLHTLTRFSANTQGRLTISGVGFDDMLETMQAAIDAGATDFQTFVDDLPEDLQDKAFEMLQGVVGRMKESLH